MVFIMLGCASYKSHGLSCSKPRLTLTLTAQIMAVFGVLLCWMLTLNTSHAESYQAHIDAISIQTINHDYCLSAQVNYALSPKALEALQNGVALYWTIRIKLVTPRAWLWDETIAELNLGYRLQYHALLNMYRVKNENSLGQQNYSSLATALASMAKLDNFPIIKTDVANASDILVKLKVEFEREALPLPLRPVAYLSPSWSLSSEWFTWPLVK